MAFELSVIDAFSGAAVSVAAVSEQFSVERTRTLATNRRFSLNPGRWFRISSRGAIRCFGGGDRSAQNQKSMHIRA